MRHQIKLAATAAFLFAASVPGVSAGQTYICGPKEGDYLSSFRFVADALSVGSSLRLRGAVRSRLTMSDNVLLDGYMARALSGQPGERAILLMQGNAMQVRQIDQNLTAFIEGGYDLFAYDYRGYGRSQGEPSIQRIIADYREIVAQIKAMGYRQINLYGISSGGIIALQLAGDDGVGRIVIDSVPSRISDMIPELTCPSWLDPMAALPEDARTIAAFAGGRDHQVTLAKAGALHEALRARGGTVHIGPRWGHMVTAPGPATRERFAAALAFFEGRP